MSIENIKEWSDAEVITHTDLNTIKTALLATLGLGNIPSSSLSWPLVAQNNLDMNGFSITNSGLLFGQIYVNADNPLADAISTARAAGGGTIVIEAGYTATAAGIAVTTGTGPIRIVGDGLTSKINVTGASYGIQFDSTYAGSCIEGVEFSGGVDAGCAVSVVGCSGFRFRGNKTTSGYTGTFLRTSGAGCSYLDVSHNHARSLAGASLAHGFELGSCIYGNIMNNIVEGATGTGIYVPASTPDGEFRRANIQGNLIAYANKGIDIVDNTHTQYYEVVISGNNLASNAATDLTVDNASDFVIQGNSTDGSVHITTLRGVFQGNYVASNATFYSVDTGIRGNDFVGTVNLVGAGDLFSDNRVHGNTLVGIAAVDTLTNNYFNGTFGATSSVGLNVGNTFIGAVTIPVITATDVYGLNKGY